MQWVDVVFPLRKQLASPGHDAASARFAGVDSRQRNKITRLMKLVEFLTELAGETVLVFVERHEPDLLKRWANRCRKALLQQWHGASPALPGKGARPHRSARRLFAILGSRRVDADIFPGRNR